MTPFSVFDKAERRRERRRGGLMRDEPHAPPLPDLVAEINTLAVEELINTLVIEPRPALRARSIATAVV